MLERYQEKIQMDEQDGQRAQEVVTAFQHAIDVEKKGVLERASESILQEEADDIESE